MRVAVLGSRGFVGAAVVRRLRSLGAHVAELARPAFDLTRRDTWEALPPVDCLVHAAGGQAATTWDTFAVNLLPCEVLARRCNELGIPRLVYLSTGRVYGFGPQAMRPGLECRPAGDYPVSKYLAERVLADTFAGRLAIARLYYPYGPGQELPRLFPRLAHMVAEGRAVTCAGDGGPRLSVSHVDDVAEVLARHFILADDPPALANLASPRVVTIAGLAEELGAHFGRPVDIIRQGPALDEFSRPYERFEWREFRIQDTLPAALRQ